MSLYLKMSERINIHLFKAKLNFLL